MKIERAIQEGLRMLKFDDVNSRYQGGKLGCEGAAELLGVDVRTFLRWRKRHEETGSSDWEDRRLGKPSPRRAADVEVEKITRLYREKYRGFNVAHFHAYLCWEEGFSRSYSWVKRILGAAGLVVPGKRGGDHRLRRPRRPQTGMMIHQDASTHNWFGENNCDLVVTMDDANSEITSAFFCPQEGTLSSMRGIAETIGNYGVFCSFYTDRGSHYWFTPEAGGKVDKTRLTEVGRALKQLGIKHIPAYSPEARGRSERMFSTLQGRLPAELALHGITTMDAANAYLRDTYQARHNREFTVPAADLEPAFIPYVGRSLADILCLQEERVVGKDNTVSYQGKILQIQASAHRHHYVKAEVTICHYPDDCLAIFHGHQCLARFDKTGQPTAIAPPVAASKPQRNPVVYHGDKCSGASRLHTYPHDKQPPPQQAVL
jgi:transposase